MYSLARRTSQCKINAKNEYKLTSKQERKSKVRSSMYITFILDDEEMLKFKQVTSRSQLLMQLGSFQNRICELFRAVEREKGNRISVDKFQKTREEEKGARTKRIEDLLYQQGTSINVNIKTKT